jgi:hypothetical protein
MNEQIRQLLLEAQDLAREQVKNTPELAKYAPSYAIPGTEIHVGLGLSYEKFAELIVRECIDIAKNWEDQLEKSNLLKESNAVGIVVYRIARQFGVKE